MRIILKLKALNSVSQKIGNLKYFNSVNSWFYKKINDSKLHNSKFFKFFSFSPLLGITNSKTELDKEYTLIFSILRPNLALKFLNSLLILEKINFGEYSFELVEIKLKKENIEKKILETLTIIEVTEIRNNRVFSIDFLKEKERYLELLKNNLIKKYNQFYNSNINTSFDLFKNIEIKCLYKKKYSIPIYFLCKNEEYKLINFIGNKLSFNLKNIEDPIQLNILKVGFDSGFGVHSSYGMGFMRVKK